MPKALCLTGMVVAILLLALFLLDLAAGFPFSRASSVLDVTFALCSAALAYLSWSTLRELD